MKPCFFVALGCACALGAWMGAARAAEAPPSTYQTPPAPIVRAIDRFMTNDVEPRRSLLSYDRKRLLVRHAPPLVSIAEHAQPRWRGNNETVSILLNQRASFFHDHGAKALSIVNVSDGREIAAALPADVRIRYEEWSPDSRWIACGVFRDGPAEVWIVNAADGSARRLTGPIMNSIGSVPLHWVDATHLLVTLIPQDIGPPPQPPAVPAGPDVQDADGNASRGGGFFSVQPPPAGDFDKQRFAYYATSELGEVALDGTVTRLGIRGIDLSAEASPDGRYILARTTLPPHKINDMYDSFPFRMQLFDRKGKLLQTIAERTDVAGGGALDVATVPDGRRHIAWRPDAPASLVWLLARDGGNFRAGAHVSVRDELQEWRAPFSGEPVTLLTSERRIQVVTWIRKHLALAEEMSPSPMRVRLRGFDPMRPASSRTILDIGADSPWLNSYPGLAREFVSLPSAVGSRIDTMMTSRAQLGADGHTLFTTDRSRGTPRTFDLRTGRESPLVQGTEPSGFVALLDGNEALILRDEENFFALDLKSGASRQITHLKRVPIVEPSEVSHQRVQFTRADGLPLDAVVHLPAGWRKEQGPLPTFVWVYSWPYKNREAYMRAWREDGREYDPYAPPMRDFRELALLGYAVVKVRPPILGDEQHYPHDRYVSELTADARALIDALVANGISDRARIGVGGHSGGGFTTANLLAHTDFFRAGIASDGVYNRTLSPFGIGAHEERSLWEAPETYVHISPIFYADRIKSPLLILRGKEEEHFSISPVESPAMFAAVKNLGGTARLVEMPAEGHAYDAYESVLHIEWEVTRWLDRYVKPAAPARN